MPIRLRWQHCWGSSSHRLRSAWRDGQEVCKTRLVQLSSWTGRIKARDLLGENLFKTRVCLWRLGKAIGNGNIFSIPFTPDDHPSKFTSEWAVTWRQKRDKLLALITFLFSFLFLFNIWIHESHFRMEISDGLRNLPDNGHAVADLAFDNASGQFQNATRREKCRFPRMLRRQVLEIWMLCEGQPIFNYTFKSRRFFPCARGILFAENNSIFKSYSTAFLRSALNH